MMFLLVLHIDNKRIEMIRADRKGSITVLPVEAREFGRLLLESLRRFSLQLANELGDRDGLTQSTQDVDMIFDAADPDRWGIEVAACSDQVSVSPLAQLAVLEERISVFGREDDVDVELGEGLRHGRAS
jgi:hypothetical protein